MLKQTDWRRRRLLAGTLLAVLVIVAAKLGVEQLGWEFISVSPLHTSIVAGAIFIIGLMLAGMMSDYKESERLPTETAAAIENIYREGVYVKALHPQFDLDKLADTLSSIPHNFRDDLVHGREHTIQVVESLSESFLQIEKLGIPPPYILRLKQEQAMVIRNLMRVSYIQRISFLPSAYTLVESIITLLIILLLFTRIDTPLTDAILLGSISFIFIYILRLLRLLDKPFGHTGSSLDDISFFQIDDIHDRMHGRLSQKQHAKHHQTATKSSRK